MAVCTRKKDGQIFVQWKEADDAGKLKVKRKYFGLGSLALVEAQKYNTLKVKANTPAAPARTQSLFFVELVNAYMNSKRVQMSATSFSDMGYKFSGQILPTLGNVRADALTPEALDTYVNKRAQLVKRTTIHRELSYIRAILNWSVNRRILVRNPMAGYTMPRRDDAVIQPISQEELQRIIDCSSPHLQRAMLLSYFCGLRPGAVELFSIRYSQVNWSAGTITIVSALKGGAGRREVPIHPALPLRSWFEADGCQEDGYVITWKGLPVKSLKTAFAAAKRRAGVSGRKIPLYSIRHTFVTTLLHMGVDIHTIANISGHDVRTMLKHYAHAMDSVRITAIGMLPGIQAPTAPPDVHQGIRGKGKKAKKIK